MKPIPKWLMIPPAVALLLALGPLSMQNGPDLAARTTAMPAAAAATEPEAVPDTGRTPALPRTPDFWQMASALLGVLLLGGLGLYGLRRLRGGAVPTRGTNALTLRQTLRLSARQALHAVEFDDRILIVGESERGLALIESGRAPGVRDDEVEAASRAAELLSAALVDDGAVPKNLVIPRPERGPRRSAPPPPATPAAPARPKGLNDFRALLQKAGRS